MFCRNCGKEISNLDKKCSFCSINTKDEHSNNTTKKNILKGTVFGLVVLIIAVANFSFSEENKNSIDDLSQEFKESLLLARPGIDDFRGKTVEEVFLNKTFISNEIANGIFASARYGRVRINNNTYIIRIELTSGKEVSAHIDFELIYNGETTLFNAAEIYNYETKVHETTKTFSDKIQIFNIFDSICVNKLY